MASLFISQLEEIAIDRIKRFARLTKAMNLQIEVGFSGGKDSQVVLHLVQQAGVQFQAYFNVSFESPMTRWFIREYYPYVIWRQYVKQGFFANVVKNHSCMLPTAQKAYCCEDYKHNPQFSTNASITGVRREESAKRRSRQVLSYKNKKLAKTNRFEDYFETSCMNTGSASPITLNPIVDWTEEEVWDYIEIHSLPINPDYSRFDRIGCMICPKCRFKSNYPNLYQYPKLIDCAIRARMANPDCEWIITSDNVDYSHDKFYYICRWLNHSFMPFSKKEVCMLALLRDRYNSLPNKLST